MELAKDPTPTPEKNRFIRFLKRLFFIVTVPLFFVLTLSVLLVYFYEDDLKALIVKELNKHLNAEVRVNPTDIDLTIIKSFPSCGLEFKNITAMEAKEFKGSDTLLYAEHLALLFNINDLFQKKYVIKKIEFEKGRCNLKIDKKGNANYMIWKSNDVQKQNDSLSFALENIKLHDIELNYKNSKQKIKIQGHISDINFKGAFSSSNYVLKSDGNAYVNLFQVQKMNYIDSKNLKFDIEFQVIEDTYTIIKSATNINATKLLSKGNFVVRDSLISLDVDFNGENLDISSSLSLLPEKFQSQIQEYKSEGEFYASGYIRYKSGTPFSIKSEFGIKHADITYKPKNTTLTNVNMVGSIDMNGNHSSLKLKDISANLNSNTFSGDLEISHFENPYLDLQLKAVTNLEELMTFYPIDTIQELKGHINITADIHGLINELKTNAYSPAVKAEGNADIKDLKFKFKQSESELSIPDAQIKLAERHLSVQHLKLYKGKSDLILDGEIPNFLSYLFDHREPLQIIANLTSDNIVVEDLIFAPTSSPSSSSVSIPDNLMFSINAHINHVSFGKFFAENLTGNILLKNQKIALNQLTLNTNDGQIKLDAFADASGNTISVSGNCNLNKLNIQSLFTQLNNFGQNTLQDKHLKGFITAEIDFTTAWDKNLQVDLSSINASSSILVERGELIGFKPLESLAKYIDVNELKRIQFSTLKSSVEIKNKTITIPRTSIQSSAINLELWGKHSFDNQIDYHIQLLLSELLAKKKRANSNLDDELSLVENDPENRRSVFIVMTGPIDNPTIKYDKKGAKEKIKEDLKQEKQTLKTILREEFGLFKKDSTLQFKHQDKTNQKFQIKTNEGEPKKEKTFTPKKKEDDDDDF